MVHFFQGFAIIQLLIAGFVVFYALYQHNYSHAQFILKLEKEMETFHVHPSIFKRGCSVGLVESSVVQRMPMMYNVKANGFNGFKAIFFNQSNLTVSGCKISHLNLEVSRRTPTFEDRWLAPNKALEPQLLLESDVLKENMLLIQVEKLDKKLWRTTKLLFFIFTEGSIPLMLKALSKRMYGALDTVLNAEDYLINAIENTPTAPDALTVLSHLLAILRNLAFLLAQFFGFVWNTMCMFIDHSLFVLYVLYAYAGPLRSNSRYRMPGSYYLGSSGSNRLHDRLNNDSDSYSDGDGDNNNETGASRISRRGRKNNAEADTGFSASNLPSPPPSPGRPTKSNCYPSRTKSRNINIRPFYGTRSLTTATTCGEATTSASTSEPAPVTTSNATPVSQPTATSSTDATPVSQPVNPLAQTTSTNTIQKASVAPQFFTAVSDAPEASSSQVHQSLQPRSPKGKERETPFPRPQSSNESASAIPGRIVKPLRSRSRSATSTAPGLIQQFSFSVASVPPLPTATVSSEGNSSTLKPDERKRRKKPVSMPSVNSTLLPSSKSSLVRARSDGSTITVPSNVQEPTQAAAAPTPSEFTVDASIVREMASSVKVLPILEVKGTANAQSLQDGTSALGVQHGQPQQQQALVASNRHTQPNAVAYGLSHQQQQYMMAHQQQHNYLMAQQRAHQEASHQHTQPNVATQYPYQQQLETGAPIAAPPASSHYNQQAQQHATQLPAEQDDGLGEDLATVMDGLFGKAGDSAVRITLVSDPSYPTLPEQQISYGQPLPSQHFPSEESRLWQQRKNFNHWQRHQQKLQHGELSQWQQEQYQRQHQQLSEWRLADEQRTHEQLHQWQLQQYQRQHEELSQWQHHQQHHQVQLYQQHFTEQQMNQEELHQWQHFRRHQSEREEQFYQHQLYQLNLYLQYVAQDIQHQPTVPQQMINEDAAMVNELHQNSNQGTGQDIGYATIAPSEANSMTLDMNSTMATVPMPETDNYSTAHQMDTTTAADETPFYHPSIFAAPFDAGTNLLILPYHRLFRTEPVGRRTGYVVRHRFRLMPRGCLSRGANRYRRRRLSRNLARRAQRALDQKQEDDSNSSGSDMTTEGPSNTEATTQYQVITRFQAPAQNLAHAQPQAPPQSHIPTRTEVLTYSWPSARLQTTAQAEVFSQTEESIQVGGPFFVETLPHDEAMALLEAPVHFQETTHFEAPTYAVPTAHFRVPTRTEASSHFQAPARAENSTYSRPFTCSEAAAYYEELNNFQLPPHAFESSRFQFQSTSLADALAQREEPTQAEESTRRAEEPTLPRTEAPFHFHLPTRSEALVFHSATTIASEASSNFFQSDIVPDEVSVIPGADGDFDPAELFETLSMAIPRPPTPPRPRQVEEPIAGANQQPGSLKIFDTDSDEDEYTPLEPALDKFLSDQDIESNVEASPAMAQETFTYNFDADPALPQSDSSSNESLEQQPPSDPLDGHGTDFSENSRDGNFSNESLMSDMTYQSQADGNDSNRSSSLFLPGRFTAPSHSPSHQRPEQRPNAWRQSRHQLHHPYPRRPRLQNPPSDNQGAPSEKRADSRLPFHTVQSPTIQSITLQDPTLQDSTVQSPTLQDPVEDNDSVADPKPVEAAEMGDLIALTQKVSVYDTTISTPPFFGSPTRPLSPDDGTSEPALPATTAQTR